MAILKDSCGRRINYLRISVNDRCDLRCTYCMPKRMSFLSRKEVLGFDEMLRLCRIFMRRGVTTFRITGGEPLIRRGIGKFIQDLGHYRGRQQGPSFQSFSLTTNGTLLEQFAPLLKENGVGKINVSLDTLDPQRYYDITRGGDLERAKRGIKVARDHNLKIRINMVALRHINEREFDAMIRWCGELGVDLCLIETMPMGGQDQDRLDNFLPLTTVKERLCQSWTLQRSDQTSSGPARYMHIKETGQNIGFISPLTHNFCSECNRVRLSCNGKLYTCLGQEDHVSLGKLVRDGATDDEINKKIDEAIITKPVGHDFLLDKAQGRVNGAKRHMNMTGG